MCGMTALLKFYSDGDCSIRVFIATVYVWQSILQSSTIIPACYASEFC